MKRRTILGSMAAATLLPAAVRAQQKAMQVIGWLSANPPISSANPFRLAFLKGLGEVGYVEAQNVTFENRWADGHYDRFPAFAADLVRRKVDVIVAVADPAAQAAKNATNTIPIVFIGGDDPVAAGFGASLARPGGNITGVTVLTGALNPKRFELLREVVPHARAIALLVNPDNLATERVIQDMRKATQPGGMQLHILQARNASEIEAAFTSAVRIQADALVVDADVVFINQAEQIAGLAAHVAIPAIYGFRRFATTGGLLSYAMSPSAIFRQAGLYTGRILKGDKPADLPIVQPTTFELVINLKTAKALGLTIPPSVLARADEVIE